MIQQVIIAILFSAALVYVGYIIYKSFRADAGCSSGCGSCGVDFSKLEKEFPKKIATKLPRRH